MNGNPYDATVTGVDVYLLPIETRVPYRFGSEEMRTVSCLRVRLTVRGADAREAHGWGETPLNVPWMWPSPLPHRQRLERAVDLCLDLAGAWLDLGKSGHPLDIGHDFLATVLPDQLTVANAPWAERMPWLAALVCCSAFDLALHDAYGVLHGLPSYDTYGPPFLRADLASFLTSAAEGVDFAGRYPADVLTPRAERLPVWHSVGGSDPLESEDLSGDEPDDGYPVLLADWIRRDGLRCLKVKLLGDDWSWDFERYRRVARIGREHGAEWLCADFNCTVSEPAYVLEFLDRLQRDDPDAFGMLLYVEQPFPYDLQANRIDVHTISRAKPLFMDESAHDWRLVELGRQLGWTGVALKTCKTQTGALLTFCWARLHGMEIMVQDLSNPMLAQIPHTLLAAHTGPLMGLESNGMQFYPEASRPEAVVHPGIYRRRGGMLDVSTATGPGFGYRIAEIDRQLPAPLRSLRS